MKLISEWDQYIAGKMLCSTTEDRPRDYRSIKTTDPSKASIAQHSNQPIDGSDRRMNQYRNLLLSGWSFMVESLRVASWGWSIKGYWYLMASQWLRIGWAMVLYDEFWAQWAAAWLEKTCREMRSPKLDTHSTSWWNDVKQQGPIWLRWKSVASWSCWSFIQAKSWELVSKQFPNGKISPDWLVASCSATLKSSVLTMQ